MKKLLRLIIVGLIAVIAVSALLYNGDDDATPNTQNRPRATTAPAIYAVEYRVGGTTKRASITYNNRTGNTEQHTVDVPWETSFEVGRGAFLYISAQNDTDRGTIACRIVQDGEVIESADSSGAYAIASCSGSAGD